MRPRPAACPRWPTTPACASRPGGGRPGVDTAHFCTQFGYPKSDANNVRALLEQMRGVTDRRAAMVSTLVALRHADDPEPLVATGRVEGGDHPRASG
jgi:inosine/xanthosine triphosphate pyrophosphatase family protein